MAIVSPRSEALSDHPELLNPHVGSGLRFLARPAGMVARDERFASERADQ